MTVQADSSRIKESVRVLLSNIVDYAGLFPPSMLSMEEAVNNYNEYRNGKFAWMLGRFIVPVARLTEFRDEFDKLQNRSDEPWQLSVLAAEDVNSTLRDIKFFNEQNAGQIICDTLEAKANTESKIENTVRALPPGLTTFFEIPPKENLAELVSMIAIRGQSAKIRTGGVTNEEFPHSREIIRFVRTSMAANVPFKATAGLHHPIKCFRPLTYAANAPKGTMHGFMNVLLMAGFARDDYRVSFLEELMEEEFDEAFVFEETGVRWRDEYFLNNSMLGHVRTRGMISFGSCSFTEPVEDLQSLGLI